MDVPHLAMTAVDPIRPNRVLCLDGGGYRGLATLSYLAEMERHFGVSCADQFTMFVGTSTGGIIALALAHGFSAQECVELYRSLGEAIFPQRAKWTRALRWFFSSRYGNASLREQLHATFEDATLGKISERGKYVAVPAYCVTSRSVRIFKTDHSPSLTGHSKYRLADIAMATSAAPTFLPSHVIAHPERAEVLEEFVDGGVFANNPSMVALTEALGYLRWAPATFSILSMSTGMPALPQAREVRSRPRGGPSWGLELQELFMHPTALMSHHTTAILTESLGIPFRRVELNVSSDGKLDDTSAKAAQTYLQAGFNQASNGSERECLRPFFETTGQRTVGGREHGEVAEVL